MNSTLEVIVVAWMPFFSSDKTEILLTHGFPTPIIINYIRCFYLDCPCTSDLYLVFLALGVSIVLPTSKKFA